MVASALAAALGGCGLFNEVDGEADGCVTTSEYFASTAWPRVFGQNCIECHSPGGPAQANLAQFRLLPEGYPGFLDTNLEHVTEFAKTDYDGTSVLIRKALGELDHGGGRRIAAGSAEHQTLETLVRMILEGTNCPEEEASTSFDDVVLLDAPATFRKAALQLAYRLPRPEESQELVDGGEDALPALVEGLFTEEAFYERLKDLFNDRFLTDRYLRYTGYAIDQLNEEQYPASGAQWDALLDTDPREAINRSVAREPLEFIAYLVKNDRPFTDLVEGQYTVVNPLSAPYLNATVSFADPANMNEWVETPRRAFIDGQLVELPSAGILTSPMFLNRFPTTETNRNRHRARMILDFFLATDILAIGERPLDPTQSSRYANPTRDDPSCNSCHEVIDPIAGAFQKFSYYDQERYEPGRSWFQDMKAPGFGEERMSVDDFDSAPTWLGQRIARDPRFPYAMVSLIYEGLVGREPQPYPTKLDDPDYGELYRSWETQQNVLRQIQDDFVASNFNLKVVVREVVLSDYFRADNAAPPAEGAGNVHLGELGTARLSNPELLSRKIEAVTGVPWVRGWDLRDKLTTDFRILYGGIDSDTVTKRLTSPNGVMASVAWRMANEVACAVTALDFARPRAERVLFREVDITDLPETEGGDAVLAAAERIRSNLRYLYVHILGETASDSEVERAMSLYVAAFREGRQLMLDGDATGVHPWLPWQCQYRRAPGTDVDLPEEERLERDPDYTLRAWMAVLSYLLSDYRFLYE